MGRELCHAVFFINYHNIRLFAVTACMSQRSAVNRRLNHGWMDEHEMEEGGQQENEQESNLEVAEALKNALQICKCLLNLLHSMISHKGLLYLWKLVNLLD